MDTKKTLKEALKSLTAEDKDESEKNVMPSAKMDKPDLSHGRNGDIQPESSNSKGTAVRESDEEDKKKNKEPVAKSETSEKSENPVSEGKKADEVESGKDSDGVGADDTEKSEKTSKSNEKPLTPKHTSTTNKSVWDDKLEDINKSLDALTNNNERFNELMEKLPDVLETVVTKSISSVREELLKSVSSGKNKTSITESEKDIDGSQDQSQKDVDSDEDGDEVDKDVQNGKNTKDLTKSEKSEHVKKDEDGDEGDDDDGDDMDASMGDKKGKDCATKSLKGVGKAVQTDGEGPEEASKSVESPVVKMTPEEVKKSATTLELAVANQKRTASGKRWDDLDEVYNIAKSARETGKEEIYKSAFSKFTETFN